jgi:hypothetical protein
MLTFVGGLKCVANGRERLASMVGLWVVGAPRMGRGSPIGRTTRCPILILFIQRELQRRSSRPNAYAD